MNSASEMEGLDPTLEPYTRQDVDLDAAYLLGTGQIEALRLPRHYGGTYLSYPGHDHWIIDEPGWKGPAGDIDDWLTKLGQ